MKAKKQQNKNYEKKIAIQVNGEKEFVEANVAQAIEQLAQVVDAIKRLEAEKQRLKETIPFLGKIETQNVVLHVQEKERVNYQLDRILVGMIEYLQERKGVKLTAKQISDMKKRYSREKAADLKKKLEKYASKTTFKQFTVQGK